MRVGAHSVNGILDVIDVKFSLTEIDKGVQHPESIVIFAYIKASVMEAIHSSIVTIKLCQLNILCKDSIGEAYIIGDNINNIMDHSFHKLSILHQFIQFFSSFFGLLRGSSISNVVLENLNRNLWARNSISSTGEP